MAFYHLNESETRYNLIDPVINKAGWNLSDRSQIWFEVPVQGYDASPQSGITDYCMFRTNGEVLAVVEAKRTRRDARVGKEQVLQYVTEIEKKQSFRPFAFMANGEDIFFWDSEQYPERMIAGFFSREDLERLLFLKQNNLPLSEIKINDTIVNRSYQTEAIRRISETVEKKNKRKALLVMATGTGKTRTIMALIDVFLRARRAKKILFLADRDSLVKQALNDGFKIHLPSESRARIYTWNIDKTARVYVSTLQTLELCYEKFSPAEFDFEGTDLEKKVTNKDTLHKQWEEFMDVCHKDSSGQLPAKTIVFAITQKHAMRLEEAFNQMYPEHKGQLARVITSGVERAGDLLDKFKKESFPRIAISVDMLDTGVDVPEVMNLAFMKPVGSQIKFWQMIGRGTRSLEACKHLEWLPERKKDNFLIVDFWENFEHFNMMPKDDGGAKQVPVLVTIFNTRLSKLELLLAKNSSPLTPLQNGEGNESRTDRAGNDTRSETLPSPEWRRAGDEEKPMDEENIRQTVFTELPKSLLENARALRKDNTKAEDFLWQLLRNRQLNGFKFRRQHPIPKGFILDFYCAETKLAIELDGAHHAEESQKEKDDSRTHELKKYGIRVIRFWNDEVINDTEKVLERILIACRKNSSPLTPLQNGEGNDTRTETLPQQNGEGNSENKTSSEFLPSPGWRRAGDEEDISRIISELRFDLSRIPLDSFTVKKNIKEVREAWEDDFWKYLTPQKIELLRMKAAPLLRFVPDVNLAEAFFTSKMERVGLLLLQNGEGARRADEVINSIREDVDLLPSSIAQVQEKISYKEAILSTKFWDKPTLKNIDAAKAALAPLMKYKRDRPSLVIELGLDDVIDSRKWVVVRNPETSAGMKMMVEEYRKKVEEKIEQLAQQHPTIQRLRKGEAVNLDDLLHLEQTLETELGTDELNLNEDNMLKAFGVRVGSLTDFLKHVLKLETLPSYEQIVRKAFDAFILEHTYNADQTRFLRTVQTVFLQKRKLVEADLYEAPFTNFGMNAIEKLFGENDVSEIIELVKKLAA